MIGKTIGKYRIVGQLGRGGMGTVYKAVDEVLGREVAIKILNSELADTGMMERFRREAIALAKLNHPGIATVYELFPSETDLLMVMELVRGEALDKISDRMGALPLEHAAYLVDKVLSALEHAHRAGIVHRDMKPANVMVTDHGGVKVMDFGVARVRGAEHVDSYMVGTPAYMSPEQVLGQQVDGRADLYSVGVVFYRLLTGTLPFKADTAIGMLQKQISDAPTPLHVHREGLPDWCEPILRRALAKAPAERFQSAEEFRDALGAATGTVAPELTKALSICRADADVTPPPQPKVFERFGLTPALAAIEADVRVAPTLSGSIDGSPPDESGTWAGPMGASPSTAIAEGATIVIPKRRARLPGLVPASVIGGITVVAILAPWRPAIAPITTMGEVPLPAVQNTPRSPGAPDETSLTRATSQPPAAATRVAGTSAQASAALPSAPAPTQGTSAGSTSTARRGTRGSASTADDTRARSSARTAPVMPVAKRLGVPFAFEARMLVADGDRQRERECQVVLADGTINIQAKDEDNLLHAVPYESVLSISYSRGRDPLWQAPAGPTPVARTGGRAFGVFRGAPHWVSLRIKNANPQFVVLRLKNGAQMTRAIAALEERTGRRGGLVPERNDEN